MPAKPPLTAWWYDLTFTSLGRYFGASRAYFGNRRPISWESGENHMVLWGGWDYWAMGGYYTFFGIEHNATSDDWWMFDGGMYCRLPF